ncbi:ABC transporter permease [Pseudenhygromyxa sp. WMMC2535]|uniref:MlaE family ABC transporter permease n=1 Tax=Pseudenhygromyxa sp. WMMC2535 TaxID=2712867 RepID=UPI00155725A9|nr:ABC transporter permease [Pseudenhygromyxa sp. WMMC2535]NVB39388.1 ABC transporter permease [Pseudenhygromyxa sp. WMMC2535]
MTGLLRSLHTLGAMVVFIAQVARATFSPPLYLRETLRIMAILVQRCIVPVSLAVAPVGAVISLQGISIFALFGAERMLSSFLGTAIFREFSPALASVMVAAQAGSSIAARIGTMKVRGQIDALAVMSIDPVRYVVVPGVIACVLVAPLLSVLTNLLGVLSGWAFAVPLGGVDHGAFMDNLTAQITPADLWVGLGKCALFGLGVGLIAGYRGLDVGKGAADVGKAANDTVVSTIVLILLTDYLLSMILLQAGL